MSQDAKKRPLNTSTNVATTAPVDNKKKLFRLEKTAPPPMTATMKRLEKLLDEDPKKKRIKKKAQSMKGQAPSSSSVLPHQSPSLLVVKRSRQSLTAAASEKKNAFASRGGLSSAPTFKKASLISSSSRSKKLSGRSFPSGQLSQAANLTLAKKATKKSLRCGEAMMTSKVQVVPPPTPAVISNVSAVDSEKEHVEKVPEMEEQHAPSIINDFASGTANTAATATPLLTAETGTEKGIIATTSSINQTVVASKSLKIGLQLGKAKAPPFKRSNSILSRSLPSQKDDTATKKDLEEESSSATSQQASIHIPELPSPSKDCTSNPLGDDEDAKLSTLSKPLKQRSLSETNNHSSITSKTISTTTSKRPRSNMNDNFVRLNLRNSAGACRGAKNKKQRCHSSRYQNYKKHQRYGNNDSDEEDNDANTHKVVSGKYGQAYVSRMSGLDPMDDYLDGVYEGSKPKAKTPSTTSNKKKAARSTEDDNVASSIPICARHNRPCKLIVVKKNTKGNKGRKFYACSMPRGEQCDHFEWAEDTIEAARKVVQGNSSHSSFVARQVAAHVDRFRNLTVPELKEEASRRRLNTGGKKSQLLLRLALWARDEITKAVPYPDDEKDDKVEPEGMLKKSSAPTVYEASSDVEILEEESDSDESSTSSDSSSGDELEFVDDDHEINSSNVDGDSPSGLAKCLDQSDDTHPDLVSTLRRVFGFSEFRDGQEWAIQNCLDGKRSLLVAPTGFGKSLCYALPPSMMDGVCVVVSPLISLIQDQLRSLPPRVPAATLSGSISVSATAAIIDDVVRKRIKILFVSPERLTSPSFRRLFNTKWNAERGQHERRFPEISLLCVDEAHCVSQWAHNFRPCFLRFKGLLHLMKPKSVLAVTATAGPRVIEDISNTLGIDTARQGEGIVTPEKNILIIDKARNNIDVSCQFVESHEERIQMLSDILKSKVSGKSSNKNKYAGVLATGSVIVYVWRQMDTEIVAENLTSAGVKGGVVMYHGGMDASARSRAQSKFMRGKARICVATVAFGMGIDKADVEGIIHLYLSSSPEHYLQEIGRAGRDGRPARAIALPTTEEVPVRHSLVHSNYISMSQIKALLFAVSKIVKESNPEVGPRSLNVALPVERLVLECDLKVETIETLLSILEQNGGDHPLLHVEGFNYDSATVAMKKRTIEKLAEKEPVAASICRVGICCERPVGEQREDDPMLQRPDAAFQRHFLAYSKGSYAFSVAKCANALGPLAESRHVFAALRRLQACGELELALDTSGKGRVIMLKTSEEGLDFFTSHQFDKKVEDLTILLHDSFSSSILSGAGKVIDINYILNRVFESSRSSGVVGLKTGKSSSLAKFQELVGQYFADGLEKDHDRFVSLPDDFSVVRHRELENDLHSVIRDLPLLAKPAPDDSEQSPVLGDSNFLDYTAVTVTKFLHGLDTARAPSKAFRGHPLFGKWRRAQFHMVLEAIKVLLKVPSTAANRD